jgi:hypothetical protein
MHRYPMASPRAGWRAQSKRLAEWVIGSWLLSIPFARKARACLGQPRRLNGSKVMRPFDGPPATPADVVRSGRLRRCAAAAGACRQPSFHPPRTTDDVAPGLVAGGDRIGSVQSVRHGMRSRFGDVARSGL